jgi:tripartite-type tricarboxylate transporter receptor subunit TctC
MVKVLKDRDVRSVMEKDGLEPQSSTPEEFGAYFKREVDKYAKVIQASGARAD